MEFLTIFGVVLLVLIVGVVIYAVSSSAENSALTKQLSDRLGGGEVFVSTWDSSFVGFNFPERKIVIGRKERSVELDFSQLIQADLLRDDTVLTSTKAGSFAARALTGAVLFGGVGAAVGAVTAKSQSVSNINQLSLRLIAETGTYNVTFFDMKNSGTTLPSQTLDFITSEANRVYGLALKAMKIVERSQPEITQQQAPARIEPTGVANELEKLWQLKQRGAISGDEYEVAKRSILSR